MLLYADARTDLDQPIQLVSGIVCYSKLQCKRPNQEDGITYIAKDHIWNIE
jgi:hypothetical protein